LAENAVVIGDVKIGRRASIWYSAVVRGDVNSITIGDYSNVQDGAVVHVNQVPSHPTVIESMVTIGHNACIHGCTIRKYALIGIGANILNGAVVGEGALVAAGALVREGQELKPWTLYAGVPAKEVRPLKDEEVAMMKHHPIHYWDDLAANYL
jgi:carbonic anhydrase/acetyltransferase-like protein (isoleucine patch superfamily)